jgi:hypothetical protein
MDIKGENVGVDLQVGLVKGTKSTSPCPDRGQSLNQRGSGAHCQCIYNVHVNQSFLLPHTVHLHRDPITQGVERWDAPLPATPLLPRR